MLGRMSGPGGDGVSEQRQREAAFDLGRHTGTASVPPMVPPKLFLAAGSGAYVAREEALLSPPRELEGPVVMASPTSTLQAAAGSPTTSAECTAVPFSRREASSPPSSSSGDGRRGCKSRSWSRSRSQQRPWEASPVGVGLAGALTNGDADALPPAATVVLTAGQRMWPCQSSMSALGSFKSRGQPALSPREMMEASSEDYTRVIARGANPRTTHIFDDRVVVVEDESSSFLRWCRGCSKDLGQGNDIFMYRGEMAFCSHECHHREMLLFDDQQGSS